MEENKSVMRSVTDILRTYNFVNTPEGRRHTVRFFSGMLVLAAGVFMVFFVAFGGGNGSDTTKPDQIYTQEHPDGGYYIGYPVELYDPDHPEWYDQEDLETQVDRQTDGLNLREKKEIRADDGTLIGYHVKVSGLGNLLSG